jgi:lantibiotic modifying enzyme
VPIVYKVKINLFMWKIVIENELECQLIEDKLKNIAASIEASVADTPLIGLIGGLAGKALFLSYYGKFKNDTSYIEKSSEILSSIIEGINRDLSDGNRTISPIFSNGLAGVFWVINHMIENDLIEADADEIFLEFEKHLNNKMLELISEDNSYDFLYGGIGIAYYLLTRNHVANRKYQDLFIAILDSKGVKNHKLKTIKWTSIIKSEEKSEIVYNFGLSHGIPSIIAYLNKYIKTYGISNNLCIELLKNSINFLLENKQDYKLYGSYFPNWISEDGEINKKGRLAWCYGDLGIGYTLYNSSLLLKDKKLEDLSMEILLKTSERLDAEKEFVLDCGLCHGTVGIANIYSRLYNISKNKKFKDASAYWIKVGLNISNHEDGIAGIKTFKGSDVWMNDTSFLEGVSGIGLGLISSISAINPNWDESILLS